MAGQRGRRPYGIAKVVEVKSANDRLSDQQVVWLHTLQSVGVRAEVCHVLPPIALDALEGGAEPCDSTDGEGAILSPGALHALLARERASGGRADAGATHTPSKPRGRKADGEQPHERARRWRKSAPPATAGPVPPASARKGDEAPNGKVTGGEATGGEAQLIDLTKMSSPQRARAPAAPSVRAIEPLVPAARVEANSDDDFAQPPPARASQPKRKRQPLLPTGPRERVDARGRANANANGGGARHTHKAAKSCCGDDVT
jgi:hypothetical protein